MLLNNLAVLYQDAGQPRARTLAQRARELAPDSPVGADINGWQWVKDGDPAAAMARLEEAFRGAPAVAEIPYHLPVALAGFGELDRARLYLEDLMRSAELFKGRSDAASPLAKLRSAS